MSLAIPKKRASQSGTSDKLSKRLGMQGVLPWLYSWEIYVIALVAGFLRFYHLDASEFDGDQAAIFGLAREAVHLGLVPIVGIRASIGIENPPAVIDLLMLPAALSANPLWAVVMVGLLNTIAVLLTYFFTRRYYGRFAGICAALLYAAAAKPLNYSRFLWQQNMLAPLIVLFMFALFYGVVERRKGWVLPAALLLGISYQLHETSTLLAIPLLVAMLLAPGTIRWRDLAFTLAALLVIFSPYIIWEFSSQFSDVPIILNVAKLHAHIDNLVIYFYRFFLSPNGFTSYYQIPANPASILRLFASILSGLRYMLWFLVAGGLVTAGGLALWPQPHGRDVAATALQGDEEKHTSPREIKPLSWLKKWWIDFRADPYRCGLTLLCVWQVVPLLFLLRHTVVLFPYYLLILMPGPFILMGLFFDRLINWTRRHAWYWRGFHYALYTIAALTIIAQITTSSAVVIDATDGANPHGKTYNDLGSLQRALTEADQLAQQRHLNRIYVTTDIYSQTAMSYLAQQIQTPTTLFDDSRCLVLPAVADGPAVLLVSPYAHLTLSLLHQYASAQLIDRPKRLGAPPFQLYIVSPSLAPRTVAASPTFSGALQLLNVQRFHSSRNYIPWVVARWKLLRSLPPGSRITYNYAMMALPDNGMLVTQRSLCTFTSTRAGDQLFVAFELPNHAASFTQVTLKGQIYTTIPYHPSLGVLHFQTDLTTDSQHIVLRTTNRQDSITTSLA
jgi:hypothetical protein